VNHAAAVAQAAERPGSTGQVRSSIPARRFPYVCRVRTRLPERYGQHLRVLIRGGMNSALVEFADGFRCVTSRNYLRKAKGAQQT
jgi:hypothetical protein